ncbi:hypothetical protein [Sphingomonas hankookensis]|uniref:hypothetical protein n=1 Tax=Sphingomonas hankookensis TaxID=563996 RepID=UPI00234E86F9|nr:hypothetical protein [Sphingomonas hankookensis]WCP71533.1 hypothetical protein PPZ50_14410 [Sphingomonas hankookensis]
MTWAHANATVQGMSNAYRQQWSGAITALDDQKGTIYVTWRDALSRLMFEGAILGGWEAHGEHMHHHSLTEKM